jgi:hypothetical protein
MKLSKFASVLLSSMSALGLTTVGFADVAENILANALPGAPSYKPSATFSDTYGEKVVTEDGSHSVMPMPEKLSAKIVGNLAGFVLADEINDDMPVSLVVGEFRFESTLAQSDEAVKNHDTFPTAKKKATFPFLVDLDLPNGNTISKRVGSIVFAWTPALLTVTLAVTDGEQAGLGEIGAQNFVGLYTDESDLGNKPSGSVKFDGQFLDVMVNFGSATGERMAIGKGVSKTTNKRFGRGDEAENLPLQSVTLAGAFDTTAPKVTGVVPATDAVAGVSDGVIAFTLSVSDTPAANAANGITPPTVRILSVGSDGSTDDVTYDPTTIPDDGSGPVTYDIVLGLLAPTTTLTIVVTDATGNATTLTKTVTSAATEFNGVTGTPTPGITDDVPATDADADGVSDGMISFSLSVPATPPEGFAMPAVFVLVFAGKVPVGSFAPEPVREGDAWIYNVLDMPLAGPKTTLKIQISEFSNPKHLTTVTRTVTSTFDGFPHP